MNRVISAKLWFMGSLLWLFPILAMMIFYNKAHSPWLGLPCALLPLVINLILITCALFPNWLFRKTEDLPLNRKVLTMLIIFMYYICIAVLLLLYSQGKWIFLYEKMNSIGIGLFFIFIGNLMPKSRCNKLFGIRCSWTMTDDEVWRKVHYWGGIETTICGIVIIILSLIFSVSQIKPKFILLPTLFIWFIIVMLHSYLIAKKLKRDRKNAIAQSNPDKTL